MNILQLQASNPSISTWVSASAGTGKTKILTDRVLRLLLKDVKPDKILCLTFTNAAAGQMHERIITQIEKWSKYSLQELTDHLEQTLGHTPTKQEAVKASGLFAAYIKTQSKINIHTIHSFCQKILKRFPLEAGISPNFRVIDELKSRQIIKIIKKQIFDMPDLQVITKFFAENFHELVIDDIFNEMINISDRSFTPFFSDSLVSAVNIDHLDQHYGNEMIYQYLQQQNDGIKEVLAEALDPYNDHDPTALKSLFLTASGEKKKRIVPKKIAHPDSALYHELQRLQDEVYRLDQEAKTRHLLAYSEAFKVIAERLHSEFRKYKKEKSLLDYNDLIIYAKKLLTHNPNKEWVLYKLDGGIDHLLVDEAQDTSKNQWQIIEALTQELYSGESGNKEDRTIFVVGDEKQSIFSFQGADINSFAYMNKFLMNKLGQGQRPFATIDLDISYRSTQEILGAVEKVFKAITKNNPGDFDLKLPSMTAHRCDHEGFVEVWPLVDNGGDNEYNFWPIVAEKCKESSKLILAEQIAKYIQQQLESGRILPSTGKPIEPGDFMILFRTRDNFTDEVIKALRRSSIQTYGLDRIELAKDLAVKDLMSIAKFVLNPDNNLNLVSLLKSPIFAFTEALLQKLVMSVSACEESISVWQYLSSREEEYAAPLESLKTFMALHRSIPGVDFFLYITDVLGYRNILNENGSDEAIDEFLKLHRSYFLEHDSSWQGFIYWFEENEITIKKDNDAEKGKVRIMTVHGAKGLQAPVVILCDTTRLPSNSERFILDEQRGLLSAKSASYVPKFYEELKIAQQQKAYQEYLRLLYVGMTRAEDHLIICGYQTGDKIPDNCWYALVSRSVSNEDYRGRTMYPRGVMENQESLEAIKESIAVQSAHHPERPKETRQPIIITMPWVATSTFTRLLAMTKPLTSTASDKTHYGIIFHKILEDAISSKNLLRSLAHPLIQLLDSAFQERIRLNLTRIINNSEFTELLRYEARTELPFGYQTAEGIKIGRVDLVIFKDNEIIIIDYKSDQNPPTPQSDIPENYRQQLRFYQEAFTRIYPDKRIICKILWLENGFFQDLK